ncbi:hypothetical protein GLAREA_00090 [Glarea lozoyensis ATCC 20868]|uniref:Cell wall mannoprotein 1 n=1 Tax=Glarea lozoyensis (strain ATCC 20868 / MF5171) TaxID=1116229 RepID=S3CR53_GLAL2|nr:uncharacterized protein GLAREA_00090 [Glarea lozoyensis ATCC 20868]EPE28932.1 hypothetical protein GLAREA_00090 [Glarea lozoyensis ATCC 20868]
MQLTTGLISVFAIAPLVFPQVLALPSPNPQVTFAPSFVTDKLKNDKTVNAANNLMQDATKFTKGLEGLFDGDISATDAINVVKLAGSGGKWLGNIKNLAKKIVDSVPDLPEIGKKAAESLQGILDEVEETYNDIKDDITDPLELMNNGGETLDKVRGLASKVACTLSKDVLPSIKVLVDEAEKLATGTVNLPNIPEIKIPADIAEKSGLDLTKCTAGDISGIPTTTAIDESQTTVPAESEPTSEASPTASATETDEEIPEESAEY